VLKACIPGCDKVELSGENQYAMAMALKIGPVAARFTGKITLSDIDPPNSYTLAFEGQGGAAGFGKGSAQVKLGAPGADSAGGCELAYTVHASVGGKVAQLGQRLVDGAAKSMAEDFFRRFDGMQQRYPQAYAEGASPVTAAQPALTGLVVDRAPGGAAWLLVVEAVARQLFHRRAVPRWRALENSAAWWRGGQL
jgi:hypothetical protein